ncbi:uncharacterized protein LOC129909577 [Episyrphus balteatus]|uniref:uncharacterized protein LOC129909577 n=1 Tax=Episyrphus balteatus TaxID=286459 RepID=UPI0024858C67|nr:uncharacterized protein LOC129909577 [Episyrphus balteatus]
MAEAKKRGARVSKTQKQILVEFMYENKAFARGQFNDINCRQNINSTWESLCNRLNSQGAIVKTVDQWKKCWTDIKSGVKKQASAYKSFLNQTGGGSITDGPRQLNDFEEKVLSIITNDAVDGDASTPELGRLEVLNENNEAVSVPLDGDVDESEPRTKKKKTTQNTYESALQQAGTMHKELVEKLDKIVAQNKEILRILQNFNE